METTNHEHYVSLEVAKLLREAGFDWEVNHCYPRCDSLDNSCSGYMEDLRFYHNINDGKYGGVSAPTLEVAQRWLREVKDILLYITPKKVDNKCKWIFWYIDLRDLSDIEQRYSNQTFNTYEEAQEAGIKKALEIINKGE